MTRTDTVPPRGGRMRVAPSRGMLSGLLLMLLGLWGALIPFIGPYFHFAYTPDSAWAWTNGRGWLEVLPGAAAFVAGLLLVTTANRAVGVFAGWLGSIAGAWFVLGPIFGRLWNGAVGAAGSPIGGTTRQVWEQIAFFSGLGCVILFLAAQGLGRFTVRSVRDVRAAEARASRPADTVVAPAAPDDTAPTTAVPAAAAPVAATPVEDTTPRRHRFFGNRTAPVEEPARTDTVAQPAVHGAAGEGSTRVDTRREG
jgi:hypothetical protein